MTANEHAQTLFTTHQAVIMRAYGLPRQAVRSKNALFRVASWLRFFELETLERCGFHVEHVTAIGDGGTWTAGGGAV